MILVAILFAGLLRPLATNANAASSGQYPPYPNIEYNYSDSVSCGTIRYISQITGDNLFNWNYWPAGNFGEYRGPGRECGTACISMALSYVGINETPKAMLELYEGYTQFIGWDGTTHTSLAGYATSEAMSNYINGNGRYSPPVIHIPGYSSDGHYVLVAGKISDDTFQILDPAARKVTAMTIHGSSATYVKDGATVYDVIDQVHQWYNPNATQTIMVTFHANGGSCSTGTKTIVAGATIGSLPTATRPNYDFLGWYTAIDGGTKVTESTTFSANTTVYAHWAESTVTVRYYDAYGSVWKTEHTVAGGEYTLAGSYPTISDGYFSGWSYDKGASFFDVRPGESICVKRTVDLYPVYVTHAQAISGNAVFIYNIDDFKDEHYTIASSNQQVEIRVDTSYWTDWSSYSTTPIDSSDAVEVKTAPMYRYYYFLCPSCGAHEPFSGISDCGANIPGSAWHEQWFTTAYSQSNYQTFSYTNAKYYTTSLGDGQLWIFSSGNLYDTEIGTIDADGNSEVITTGYSSRSYVQQYSTISKIVMAYVISRTECAHQYTAVVTPPSCEEMGYTTYTCVKCGNQYTDNYVDALGHSWDGGVITREPTSALPGMKTYTCTRCGKTRDESIPATGKRNPFVDVAEGRFYYAPVLWAVEQGITSGMDATHFDPEGNCTRGQVVAFLWRAMGCPEPRGTSNPFVDVKPGRFYYKAVLWAAENGITAGMDATHFAPDATVTRGQFVTFLWRAEGKPTASGNNPFADVASKRFYYSAVLWAAENNITAGMAPGQFMPERTCTRGQVVTFLYRDLAK